MHAPRGLRALLLLWIYVTCVLTQQESERPGEVQQIDHQNVLNQQIRERPEVIQRIEHPVPSSSERPQVIQRLGHKNVSVLTQQKRPGSVQQAGHQNVLTSITEEEFLAILAPITSRNEKCRSDSLLYLQHLRNSTLWAVKMFDASAKVPVGLLAGSTYQMGHFDECLQVGSEDWPTEVVPAPAPVRGQYCLARLHVTPLPDTYPGFTREDVPHAFSLQYDPRLSAWEKLMIPRDPSKKRRDVFHWAACVPASCKASDVKSNLEVALVPLARRHGVQVNVDVDENLCQTSDKKPLETGDIFVILIIVVTLLMIIGSSAYDMIVYRRRPQSQENTPLTRGQQVLLSFSAYSNLEKLNKPDSTDEMGILHGLRLFSMVFIILGHRCLFTYGGPFFNPEFLEERYRKIEDMFLLNGTLLVDTFFVLSGFLTCFGILLELHKRKTLSLPMLYLYRWMRLTPVYMMVVAFYATLLNKVDSGPIWNARVGQEKQRCVENWWTNLLYINNYVNSDQLCMFQSWYIACDMHYFLLAPLLVIPLYRRPGLGLAALGTVLLLTIIVPFAVTYAGAYSGVLRVYMSLLEDPPSKEDYFAVYIKSHNRAGPYFIGMAAAYLYGIFKLNGVKISTRWMWICSLIATFLGLSSLFGAWVFYIPGREYFPFENATYASLHRWGWALTVAWVVIGGCTTRFSVLQPILQLHAFLPLSRLTYCAFLTHGAVQLYTLGTLRQPEFMSFPKLFWMAAGDVTMSFIFALFVYLFFEAPLGGIQKMLLKKPAKPAAKGGKAGENVGEMPMQVQPPQPPNQVELATSDQNKTEITSIVQIHESPKFEQDIEPTQEFECEPETAVLEDKPIQQNGTNDEAVIQVHT